MSFRGMFDYQPLPSLDGIPPASLNFQASRMIDVDEIKAEIKAGDDGINCQLITKIAETVTLLELNKTLIQKKTLNQFVITVNRYLFFDGVGLARGPELFKKRADSVANLASSDAILTANLIPIIQEANLLYKEHSPFLIQAILDFLVEKNPHLHSSNRLMMATYIDSYHWAKGRRWTTSTCLEFAKEITMSIADKFIKKIKNNLFSDVHLKKLEEESLHVIKKIQTTWASNHPESANKIAREYAAFFRAYLLSLQNETQTKSVRCP